MRGRSVFKFHLGLLPESLHFYTGNVRYTELLPGMQSYHRLYYTFISDKLY